MTGRTRLAVVGWDGVDLALLGPWIAQGRLPNVARLVAEGVRGRLASPLPANSFTSWTTFFTGLEPGRHGVYGFLDVEPKALARRAHALDRLDAPPLWDVLAAQGVSTGVVNLPNTYPPEAPRGFMVSGILTPEERVYAAPAALEADLRARFAAYRVDASSEGVAEGEAGDAEFLRRVRESERARASLALDLLDREAPEAFVVVFTGTDRLLHRMWRRVEEARGEGPVHADADAIRAFFAELDAFLGALRARLGEGASLALVSDHGFGPRRLTLRLNRWLADEGHLALRGPSPGARLRGVALAAMGSASRVVRAVGLARLRRLAPVARALGPLDRAFTRLGDRDWAERVRAIVPGVDWRRTRAYLGGAAEEGVRINLRGREALGVVAPGREYEALRASLIAGLAALRAPASGAPLFTGVHPREKVFEGPRLESAPDIVLETNPEAGVAFEEGLGAPALAPEDGAEGCHRRLGMFVASGGAFAAGRDLGDLAMVDALPTLLAALGAEAPEDGDGRAAPEAFATPRALRRAPPVPRRPSGREPTAEESAALRDRLVGIGYLE